MDLFTPHQTYGYCCHSCGELWDAYVVPCPMEVAIRNMKANRICITCDSPKVLVVNPGRYEELKVERAMA